MEKITISLMSNISKLFYMKPMIIGNLVFLIILGKEIRIYIVFLREMTMLNILRYIF